MIHPSSFTRKVIMINTNHRSKFTKDWVQRANDYVDKPFGVNRIVMLATSLCLHGEASIKGLYVGCLKILRSKTDTTQQKHEAWAAFVACEVACASGLFRPTTIRRLLPSEETTSSSSSSSASLTPECRRSHRIRDDRGRPIDIASDTGTVEVNLPGNVGEFDRLSSQDPLPQVPERNQSQGSLFEMVPRTPPHAIAPSGSPEGFVEITRTPLHNMVANPSPDGWEEL